MQYNYKKIIAGLIIIIISLLMIWQLGNDNVFLSIGTSLMASALVIMLNIFLVEAKVDKETDKWGVGRIYATRAEKNKDSDPRLDKLKYKLDGIAFGLKTFRTGQSDRVEAALKRGVQIRLITMLPTSDFVRQREIEEKEQAGQIENTINQLVKWADNLNSKGYKGKIQVKGYNCMTLDFYWRMDDVIYMGPYWYGRSSQQTITYRLDEGGKAFKLYEKYFEELWNASELMTKLTKE